MFQHVAVLLNVTDISMTLALPNFTNGLHDARNTTHWRHFSCL